MIDVKSHGWSASLVHQLADNLFEELVLRAPSDDPKGYVSGWASQRGLAVIAMSDHPEMADAFAHGREIHGVSFGSDDPERARAMYERFAASLVAPAHLDAAGETGHWIVTSLHRDPALSWEERFTMIEAPAQPDVESAFLATLDSGDSFALAKVVGCSPTALSGALHIGDVLVARTFTDITAWRACFASGSDAPFAQTDTRA